MEESIFTLVELNLQLVSSLSLYDSMNSLFSETISTLSVFSSDPLFSCVIAFYTLVFLYLPHLFWKIVFSPVLILTCILLLIILRLGAAQKSQNENYGRYSEPVFVIANEENRGSEELKQSTSPIEWKETKPREEWISSRMGFESSSCFVEWNVKMPLEVIYEGEEGEEERGEHANENDKEENHHVGVAQRCHLESDSDSSSESEFPAITGEWNSTGRSCLFRWDDEEDREGFIEIALDGCVKKRDMEFQFEEENLIEIDISPMRFRDLSGEDDDGPFNSVLLVRNGLDLKRAQGLVAS